MEAEYEVMREMISTMQPLDRDPEVGCFIISGSERAFAAGADIEEMEAVVKTLRLFSRLDEASAKPVDLHEGLETTLELLQYRMRVHGS